MLVSLIPFFLVANVPVDEVSWKYGPEFVFDVEANFTAVPVSPDGELRYSKSAVASLFCRPKEADKLSCHLGNLRKCKIDSANDNLDLKEHEMKNTFSEKQFEIKFNSRGIEHLIVEENIFTGHLNLMKTIVELLNIGVDLNGKQDGTFYALENSTIGQCNVTYVVNHSPHKGALRKLKSLDFELESLPPLNKVPGEAIVIQKLRNLNNCTVYADYYYGTYGEDTVIESELDSHLTRSSNHIFVSDTQFESTLTKMGEFDKRNKKHHVAMTDQLILTLKDIRPAKQEIPKIPKASETTIEANSLVYRIPPHSDEARTAT